MAEFFWPGHTLSGQPELVPYSMSFYLQPYTGGSESPFTRQTKVYNLAAPRWICRMQFRGGPDYDWGETGVGSWGPRLDAFIAKLKGRTNRALIWDFRRPGRLVAVPNAAIAAGATQVTILGNPSFAKLGEYIGGDGRPHIITDIQVSGGNQILTVEPPFQTAIGAGAADFEQVTGYFRLTSDDAGMNPTEVGGLAQYDLEFVEDFGAPPVDVVFGTYDVVFTP